MYISRCLALNWRRRSSSTTRLRACSDCTCRAQGAQALRCYEPPDGGKTTRGRAFVVGIGHPRRELSPPTTVPRASRRHLRSCRACTLRKKSILSLRALLYVNTGAEEYAVQETVETTERCAVDFGTRDINLWDFGCGVDSRSPVQFVLLGEEMEINSG